MKATSKPRQFHVVDQRPLSEGPLNDTIDPRSPDEEGTTGPIEDLVDLPVSDKEPSKVLKIGKNMSNGIREAISEFLRQNLNVFAWAHSNMEGIDHGRNQPQHHESSPQHRPKQEASQTEKVGYEHRALSSIEGKSR